MISRAFSGISLPPDARVTPRQQFHLHPRSYPAHSQTPLPISVHPAFHRSQLLEIVMLHEI
jgi:hypothetical protein